MGCAMKLEILITVLSLGVAPLAHLMGTTPSTAGLVLMVTPFWNDAGEVAAAAGARVVGTTRALFGTLIAVEEVTQFADLSQAGAWFPTDPETSKWICGS